MLLNFPVSRSLLIYSISLRRSSNMRTLRHQPLRDTSLSTYYFLLAWCASIAGSLVKVCNKLHVDLFVYLLDLWNREFCPDDAGRQLNLLKKYQA